MMGVPLHSVPAHGEETATLEATAGSFEDFFREEHGTVVLSIVGFPMILLAIDIRVVPETGSTTAIGTRSDPVQGRPIHGLVPSVPEAVGWGVGVKRALMEYNR